MCRRPIWFLFLALAVIHCGERSVPYSPGELTIAAGSSLGPALDTLLEEWNRTNPETPARAIYGASGAMYARVGSSSPFDIFLSSDELYPRRLHERGLTEVPFRYATGTLVIWIPDEIDPIEGPSELSDPRFEAIAIPGPNLAPYGKAALEALEGLGIYDDVKLRLLFASNASEAATDAESRDAEAAILPLSLVRGTRLDEMGQQVSIDVALHDTIVHHGAIISASPDRDAAIRFAELLLSETGQAVLRRHGFETDQRAPTTDSGK